MEKTEFEKMRSAELCDFSDPEIVASAKHAKILCAKIRQMSEFDDGYREALADLIPGVPDNTDVLPPITCDHGHGIRLGEHVFVNSDCIFLDSGLITVGDYTLIGPGCKFFTSQHPIDYKLRRKTVEYELPITIGRDCWIGGGATICPGVTIGDRVIVAAGSVVTKDVPSDALVAGCPAVVKKWLNQDEMTVI